MPGAALKGTDFLAPGNKIFQALYLTSEVENEPETGSFKNTWHVLPVVVQTCFAVTRQTSLFVPIHNILTHAFDCGLAVSNTYKKIEELLI